MVKTKAGSKAKNGGQARAWKTKVKSLQAKRARLDKLMNAAAKREQALSAQIVALTELIVEASDKAHFYERESKV